MDRSRRPLAATALAAFVWTGSTQTTLGAPDPSGLTPLTEEIREAKERARPTGTHPWQPTPAPAGLTMLCQVFDEGGEFPNNDFPTDEFPRDDDFFESPGFESPGFESPGLSLESDTVFEDLDFKDLARRGPDLFRPPLLMTLGQARAERVAAMLMDDLVRGPGGEIYFETDAATPALTRGQQLRRRRSIFDVKPASGGDRNNWRRN